MEKRIIFTILFLVLIFSIGLSNASSWDSIPLEDLISAYNETWQRLSLNISPETNDVMISSFDIQYLFDLSSTIGGKFIQNNRYDEALFYYGHALRYTEYFNDHRRRESQILNNMGICYLKLGDLINSQKYFSLSEKIKEDLNKSANEIDFLNILNVTINLEEKIEIKGDWNGQIKLKEKLCFKNEEFVDLYLVPLIGSSKGFYLQKIYIEEIKGDVKQDIKIEDLNREQTYFESNAFYAISEIGPFNNRGEVCLNILLELENGLTKNGIFPFDEKIFNFHTGYLVLTKEKTPEFENKSMILDYRYIGSSYGYGLSEIILLDDYVLNAKKSKLKMRFLIANWTFDENMEMYSDEIIKEYEIHQLTGEGTTFSIPKIEFSSDKEEAFADMFLEVHLKRPKVFRILFYLFILWCFATSYFTIKKYYKKKKIISTLLIYLSFVGGSLIIGPLIDLVTSKQILVSWFLIVPLPIFFLYFLFYKNIMKSRKRKKCLDFIPSFAFKKFFEF